MMHQTARLSLQGEFKQVSFQYHIEADPHRKAQLLEHCERVLDVYNRYRLCATEWDADQWGLDPDCWLVSERAEMRRRGGTEPPIEAIDRFRQR